MSEISRPAEQSALPSSEIVGYVEAFTADCVIGWVWRPGRSDRIAVELRSGEEFVARSVADGAREDLARNGIGDGNHAFTLPIPEPLRSKAAELRVVALRDDGAAVRLGTPTLTEHSPPGAAQLQRGIEMLISSQRLLHRNLQAVLLREGPSVAESIAEVTAAQSRLQDSIATVELFVVRLEQTLGAPGHGKVISPTHRSLMAVVGLSGAALVASCVALWRVMVAG